jgi:hypothetical protein
MSLSGILILHDKHSWSVSSAIPDLAYKIISPFPILLNENKTDLQVPGKVVTSRWGPGSTKNMDSGISHAWKYTSEDKSRLPSFSKALIE